MKLKPLFILPAILLTALNLTSSSRADDSFQAPEDCWAAISGDRVMNGAFIFSFDGAVGTNGTLARFIDEAYAMGLSLYHVMSIDLPGEGSSVSLGLRVKKSRSNNAQSRSIINDGLRELMKKTPGVRAINCDPIQEPYPSTRTGN